MEAIISVRDIKWGAIFEGLIELLQVLGVEWLWENAFPNTVNMRK